MVNFDADGKILQIRQSWDQGSLLKLIDIIGRTGRNWPIRDGRDQIKLITSSVKLAGKAEVDPIRPGDARDIARSRGNSNNVTRDPHATLSLFAPREKYTGDSLPAIVATRTSAAPPPRNYHDLFVGNESDQSPASNDKRFQRSAEPEESTAKAGAGKNYARSRLFDEDDTPNDVISPKVNAKKFSHFNFNENEEEEAAPIPQRKAQHTAQWSHGDENTPAKPVPGKVQRANDVRHWGNSDDEVLETPIKAKRVDKPRKDAAPHFDFVDDGTGTPDSERRQAGRPRGAQANNGMGLYRDRTYGDEEDESERLAHHAANIAADTNARRKVFDSQFSMTDVSPAGKPKAQEPSNNHAKAVKMMDANWASYDQSPSQKENGPSSPIASRGNASKPLSETTNVFNQGIATMGDGMGGRKAVVNRETRSTGIATGGDGMGGKKGAGRQWGFGDESDGEEEGGNNAQGKFATGKTQGKRQPTGGDFWDF